MQLVSEYFGANKKGVPNFKPESGGGLRYFVGTVKSGTQKFANIPCFFIDGDLGIESYRAICKEVKTLGYSGKVHVFAKGLALIQSPNIMFHKVSKDGAKTICNDLDA